LIIHVDQELCSGCGTCLDACSTGAIQLVDQRAVIDDVLCKHCQACADACPNEAITAILIPAQSSLLVMLPDAEPHLLPIQQSEKQSVLAAPARRLTPLAGTALAFLGHEIAPRLADIFIGSLERRLTRPATTATNSPAKCSRKGTLQRQGVQRQTRYRRGRIT